MWGGGIKAAEVQNPNAEETLCNQATACVDKRSAGQLIHEMLPVVCSMSWFDTTLRHTIHPITPTHSVNNTRMTSIGMCELH